MLKRERNLTLGGIVLLALTAVMLLPGFLSAGGKNVSRNADADARAKSRYYTRKAYMLDSTDQTFELYRYASQLDTGNYESGFNYGLLGLLIVEDSAALENCRRGLLRYIERYPGDLNEASLYATVSSELLGDDDESIRVLERLTTIYPERSDVLNTLFRLYGRIGEVDKALTTIRRYEQQEGMDVSTVSSKIGILLGDNDTAGAFLALDTLLSNKPHDMDAWILRGSLYLYCGNQDSTLSSLRHAESIAPYRFSPKMELASFYNQIGDSVMSDKMIVEALKTNDVTVEEKCEGITSYVQELLKGGGSGRRAFPMYEELLRQDPDNLMVLSSVAALQDHEKMYKELEQTLRRLLSKDKKQVNAWLLLMGAYLNDGDYKGVEAIFNEAKGVLEELPSSFNLYLASAYTMDKKPEKSAEVLFEAVRSYLPDYSDTVPAAALLDTVKNRNYNEEALGQFLLMLGDSYVSMKDSTRGFRVYEQTLGINPTNVMAMNNYAYFLALQKRDLDKALSLSKESLELNPDNGTFLDTYAYILFLKGDYEKARTYQEMAIEKTPEGEASADLYDHYGDILWFLGNKKLAAENWRKALDKAPDNTTIQKKVKEGGYYEK